MNDPWPYPENMTIKQLIDAGYLENPNTGTKSLFELTRIQPPKDEYDSTGKHKSRYAKEYNLWKGYCIPKRIDKMFWVGVEEGNYQSKPVQRIMTSCFAPKPVFRSGIGYVFDMDSKIYAQFPSNDLYEIPTCEYWALQNIGEIA